MKPRLLIFGGIALLAAVAVVVVLLVVKHDDPPPAANGKYCPPPRLAMYFKTDDEMRAAAGRLASDSRLKDMKTETKIEAYQHFQQIFANQPDVLKLATPEAMPPNVQVSVDRGVDKNSLVTELRSAYSADRVDDICDAHPGPVSTPPSTQG